MDLNQVKRVATPSQTKQILRQYGLTLKKSLGQNFLVDPSILERIVRAADLEGKKGVIEIGPGIGALTQRLAECAHQVLAVEIDQRFLPALQQLQTRYANVRIVHGDVLKVHMQDEIDALLAQCEAISVVANLPYYVTTPILMKMLEERWPLEHIVVMVQKEVAERMAAAPGGKDYGSLSVAVQYYCQTERVLNVPSSAFIPPPGVDSTVIKLMVHKEPPVAAVNEAFFFETVRASFAQRRKTIFNNLATRFFDKQTKEQLTPLLEQCGIDPSRRGETLALSEFAELSNKLYKHLGPS